MISSTHKIVNSETTLTIPENCISSLSVQTREERCKSNGRPDASLSLIRLVIGLTQSIAATAVRLKFCVTLIPCAIVAGYLDGTKARSTGEERGAE